MFSAVNFILLAGYSGAIICIFAIIQTVINNFFERKEEKVPKYVVGIYIIISIICGLITYKKLIDILSVICSILYTMSILQSKEKNIRKLSLINILLWIVYDIISKAYTAAISDISMTISTLIGMYRYDYRKELN